jgi:RNA polymerase sigma factor (sigma-70 family)
MICLLVALLSRSGLDRAPLKTNAGAQDVTAARVRHIQAAGFVCSGMDNSRSDAPGSDRDWLAAQFQAHRSQLYALAYRMLGSLRDAEDAVQETWLRLDRSDTAAINDLRTWLSTVAGRVCLDMLRSRKASHEHYTGTWLPEPLIGTDPAEGPEQQAVLADSVSMALLVVLEALTPAERLAFVLHDIFEVPFNQIAPVVDRTPQATRQLASRARRRVQQAPLPDPDPGQQRQVVDAFLAAARHGDFDALVAVLHPGVVFRADPGPGRPRRPLHGARPVARRVLALAPRFASLASPITVNGAAGALFGSREDPIAVTAFTVTGGRISSIDLISDPDKLRTLTLPCGAHEASQAD